MTEKNCWKNVKNSFERLYSFFGGLFCPILSLISGNRSWCALLNVSLSLTHTRTLILSLSHTHTRTLSLSLSRTRTLILTHFSHSLQNTIVYVSRCVRGCVRIRANPAAATTTTTATARCCCCCRCCYG